MSGRGWRPTAVVRENRTTDEGRALGREMARLCDTAAAEKGRDGRCATCAFRAGDHLANGSPETLITALKCAMEQEPFYCHEHDRVCRGWALARFAEPIIAPWPKIDGFDEIRPLETQVEQAA